MKAQAQNYGAAIETGRVTRIDRDEGGFCVEWGSGPVRARTVLLATGVRNRRPPMDEDEHDAALARGLIRYCPICDGYEVTDKTRRRDRRRQPWRRRGGLPARLHRGRHPDRAGHGARPRRRRPGAGCASSASQASTARAATIAIDGERIVGRNAGRPASLFDSVYPALGSDVRNELAGQLGAALNDTGCILVDAHQRTNVPGLYAAGDVVIGLDQISHAMGEGGVAATTIRNDLAKERPLLR